jgi:hypothetical protein
VTTVWITVVVTQTLGEEQGVTVDARLAGVAAAGAAIAARRGIVLVVVLAAATTALVRALS